MTTATPRLALPLLAAGQAQKEVFHNEALALLDALVQPAVEDGPVKDPPANPDAGKAWLVGPVPTGAWIDHGDTVALWSDGGWRFVVPSDGMLLWHRAEARWTVRVGDAWTTLLPVGGVAVDGARVVGARQPAITDPAGGSIIDTAARAAVAAILAALRSHGLIAS